MLQKGPCNGHGILKHLPTPSMHPVYYVSFHAIPHSRREWYFLSFVDSMRVGLRC